MVAKVGELDRANLHEGQDVKLRLDAVPDKEFHGKIKGMSGTASANVFSGDPAKKFDVIFSVDMRELLTALGVKPEQIKKILEEGARNAKKAPPSAAGGGIAAMVMGGGPGAIPGGMPGGMPGAQGGEGYAMQGGTGGPEAVGGQAGQGGAGGGRMRRGGGGGGSAFGAGLSDQDRAKMREMFQQALGGKNIRDLTPEDRQKIIAKIQEQMKKGQSKGGGQKGVPSGPAERKGGDRGGRGPGAPGGGGSGQPNPLEMIQRVALGQFSEEDRTNAKLPVPPEEDTQLAVLLRPGLLADVEITVEKMANALHVPAQAVFEKDGKAVVFVQTGGRFEQRPVQLEKRSESLMVLKGGVKPGEVIAMSDPYARKADKKGDKKGSGGAGMPLPAGGGK